MKIAVTADLHLTTRKEHPERFNALEDILTQMIAQKIDTLIIAGDLFHESSKNYADFEAVCKDPSHWGIRFLIIPGNHDTGLSNKVLAAENIEVITTPKIKKIGPSERSFLFLPYAANRTMGEAIAGFKDDLKVQEWILIGHGDWVEGMREINPFEPGTYMPLTRTDVENFKPRQVALGHIHKPISHGNLTYPGSPCPMDITETGRRRFLILDSETGAVTSQAVNTDTIYFDESLIVIPVENQEAFIKNAVESMIAGWNIPDEDKSKIKLRLKVSGYATDRTQLRKTLKESLKGISLIDKEPDISQCSVSEDIQRAEIARRVQLQINELAWPDDNEPNRDQILLEALGIIYGDA